MGDTINISGDYDNAVAESFFGSLKQERVRWRNYQTRLEARQDVMNYISMFYNSHRLHSYLGYVSPNEYEAEMVELKKAAQLVCKETLDHIIVTLLNCQVEMSYKSYNNV